MTWVTSKKSISETKGKLKTWWQDMQKLEASSFKNRSASVWVRNKRTGIAHDNVFAVEIAILEGLAD